MASTHCIVRRNKTTSFGGVKVKFLKDVSREMRKVSWPKNKELVSYTITVIATVAFVAVFFAIIDLLISQVLNRL